jgi:fumarate reductase flavoprotein subunit
VIESSHSADLVIVGAGLAGCVAALTAAEAGAQVVLLEKLDQPGGSSVMSAGCLAFAGTDLQRSHGIDDSAETLYRDLREVGKQENVIDVVKAYAEEQLATYAWLRECGVKFRPLIEASSGQSVPRVHCVDPAGLIRLLVDRCRSSGRVDLQLSSAAERLLRSHDRSPVNAVEVSGPAGSRSIATRRGAVLAAGGFGQDRALVHRYAPQYDAAIFIGGAGCTGDGLRMACALGADLWDMAYIKGTFGKHPIDTSNPLNCMAVYKGAIAVNQAGVRFVDESLSYKLLGDACMVQPSHVAYQILDQDILESGEDGVPILDLMRRFEDGLFETANTLEELATRIKTPPQSLRQTIERYNRSVEAGKDSEFGRQHLVHHHGALRRIVRPPFHAYPSTAAVFGTYCGVAVDRNMRVLDVFGDVIPGVYAAGEVVGGLHGAAYMTGSALAKAAIFGRIAARSALEN